MPKLWSVTIEAHRREVHDAIIDTTATLVANHGLRAVTMSQIAETTGIGRATLYKYFPDVESILMAWHEGQVTDHLQQLVHHRDHARTADEAIRAVLDAYALIIHELSRQHHGTDLTGLVHQDQHVARAQQELRQFLSNLMAEGVKAGGIRNDVAPQELATSCLHAMAAASGMPPTSAVHRLVMVTIAGLSPQHAPSNDHTDQPPAEPSIPKT